MIGILNYGLGNSNAFLNAFSAISVDAAIIDSGLHEYEKFILPGVGHFDAAISSLKTSPFFEELVEQVLIKRKPILGVCVGMQIMGTHSSEGLLEGLGWLDLDFNLFSSHTEFKGIMPHTGWNTCKSKKINPILNGIEESDLIFLIGSCL